MTHVTPETIISRMTEEQAKQQLVQLTTAARQATRILDSLPIATLSASMDAKIYTAYEGLIRGMDLSQYLTDEDREELFR